MMLAPTTRVPPGASCQDILRRRLEAVADPSHRHRAVPPFRFPCDLTRFPLRAARECDAHHHRRSCGRALTTHTCPARSPLASPHPDSIPDVFTGLRLGSAHYAGPIGWSRASAARPTALPPQAPSRRAAACQWPRTGRAPAMLRNYGIVKYWGHGHHRPLDAVSTRRQTSFVQVLSPSGAPSESLTPDRIGLLETVS